ncbi:MAG: rod shape-determining protein [Myxococcota bacterium]
MPPLPIPARLCSDLAIDLGTANTIVYGSGQGLLLDEPSVVALSGAGGGQKTLRAVGREAKEMLGRTPGDILVIRPLRDGVIADFEAAEAMLRYFITRSGKRSRWIAPRVVVAVPSGITEIEQGAVRESARSAGARRVYLVEESMAAAIGAGLAVTEPRANAIVDIGGGTTEVAVISLSGIVCADLLRVAGDKLDAAIRDYVRRKYNLLIGEQTAERVKLRIGTALPSNDLRSVRVKGQDLIAGVPRAIELKSSEVSEALSEPLNAMVGSVKAALERIPPELAADVVDRGITMVGGGSLLANLDLLLREETGLRVAIAEEPLMAVARGAARCLDDPALLRQVMIP